MNKVLLVGNLIQDMQPRTTSTGKKVVSFPLLVTDLRNSKVSHIFRCTAWEQRADFLVKYAKKGSSICVDGRLEARKYTNNEGREVNTIDVAVDNVSFANSSNRRQTDSARANATNYNAETTSTWEPLTTTSLGSDVSNSDIDEIEWVDANE